MRARVTPQRPVSSASVMAPINTMSLFPYASQGGGSGPHSQARAVREVNPYRKTATATAAAASRLFAVIVELDTTGIGTVPGGGLVVGLKPDVCRPKACSTIGISAECRTSSVQAKGSHHNRHFGRMSNVLQAPAEGIFVGEGDAGGGFSMPLVLLGRAIGFDSYGAGGQLWDGGQLERRAELGLEKGGGFLSAAVPILGQIAAAAQVGTLGGGRVALEGGPRLGAAGDEGGRDRRVGGGRIGAGQALEDTGDQAIGALEFPAGLGHELDEEALVFGGGFELVAVCGE